MSPRYGQIIEGQVVDNDGSTVEEITNMVDYSAKTNFRRATFRVKVENKQQETEEYIKWSNQVEEKRRAGTLVIKDDLTKPQFVLEYPKTDQDGSYFVIRSFTEIII
jgi:C4-type Zn-finger protein